MAKLKQFLSESEITDDLKGAYTKEGDRYKLNDLSDDHSLVVAHGEVKTKAENRQAEVDNLTAEKSNLTRERDEFKNKTVPNGFRAVKKEIAELGEAAQTAGFTREEISTVKTVNAELQKQIDDATSEKVIAEVAADNKLNNRFKLTAKDKGWKFEKEAEKVDGKDVEVWKVVNGDVKTKLDEFFSTDAYAKEFAETFKTGREKTGNTFDPPPHGKEDLDAAQAAQAAQAQSTRFIF